AASRTHRVRREAPRWLVRGVVGVACMVALASCRTPEAVFTVTTGDDSVDVAPGDGTCEDAVGECSLRAAVMEANAHPGFDQIVLADGVTHELTIEGADEDDGLTGDLDVTEAVDIVGDGTI